MGSLGRQSDHTSHRHSTAWTRSKDHARGGDKEVYQPIPRIKAKAKGQESGHGTIVALLSSLQAFVLIFEGAEAARARTFGLISDCLATLVSSLEFSERWSAAAAGYCGIVIRRGVTVENLTIPGITFGRSCLDLVSDASDRRLWSSP